MNALIWPTAPQLAHLRDVTGLSESASAFLRFSRRVWFFLSFSISSWRLRVKAKGRLISYNAWFKIPVVAGLPFGHIPLNATLPVGVRATLDAIQGDLIITEAAVR